jgi:hypothetical protein
MTPTPKIKACPHCGLRLSGVADALKHLEACEMKPADQRKTLVDTPSNPMRKGFSRFYRHPSAVHRERAKR